MTQPNTAFTAEIQQAQPSSAPHLAALVASRICHDLISPLGAIGNGVELLAMPPLPGSAGLGSDMPGAFAGGAGGGHFGPELQLITESVESAKARVRLFRVAFGHAAPEQRMGRPEIVAMLDDVAQAGRLSFDWQVAGDHARRDIKMVMLAILCLETALPRGGRVLICQADDGLWRLIAEASRTKPEPTLWHWLGTPEGGTPCPPDELAEITPALVQFALLSGEASAVGRHIEWEMDATGAEISF